MNWRNGPVFAPRETCAFIHRGGTAAHIWAGSYAVRALHCRRGDGVCVLRNTLTISRVTLPKVKRVDAVAGHGACRLTSERILYALAMKS